VVLELSSILGTFFTDFQSKCQELWLGAEEGPGSGRRQGPPLAGGALRPARSSGHYRAGPASAQERHGQRIRITMYGATCQKIRGARLPQCMLRVYSNNPALIVLSVEVLICDCS